MKTKVKLLDESYKDGEWVNQFYEWIFLIDDVRVEITQNLTKRGNWSVTWDEH